MTSASAELALPCCLCAGGSSLPFPEYGVQVLQPELYTSQFT